MKTFKNILAVAMMVVSAATASAQVITPEQAAVLATIPGNSQTTACSKVQYHFVSGQLTGVEVEKHSGVFVRPFGGVSMMTGESGNWGDLSATTGMGGIAVGVTHHRKNWPVDLLVEGYGVMNSRATVETLSTTAFELGVSGMVGINPCGSFKLYVGGTAAYVNSTSRYLEDNESYKLDIPYKGNALFVGPSARIAVKLFTINSTKHVSGVPVTKKHAVNLVVDGKYLFGKVGEPDGSKAKERRAEITAGIQFSLF